MSIEAINEKLLRAIGVGVALLTPDELAIRFRNEAFREWFDPAEVGTLLSESIADLDVDALKASLAENGRYDSEASVRRKRRRLVVALTFTRTEADVIPAGMSEHHPDPRAGNDDRDVFLDGRTQHARDRA